MMIQFTTRNGGSLSAFAEPRGTQTPVPTRIRLARSVAVVIAVIALAVFVGIAGHALRRPEASVTSVAGARAFAQPHRAATADAGSRPAQLPRLRQS